MGRRIHLLVAVALFLGVATDAQAVAAATSDCDFAQRLAGICTSSSSDGTGVDVRGTTTRRGAAGSASSDRGRGSGPGRALTDAELTAMLNDICFGNGVCGLRNSVMLNPRIPARPGAPAGAGANPAPAVTLDDVARFLPASAALHGEPDGWAVVGAPANFWADASAITVPGELLDQAAEVRFTPQAYRFDYGDGSFRSSATAGASWSALGQQELTETPTSHVYRVRGAVQARVTVVYSAQYRFADGPWTGVAGAVSSTTPPQRVLVVVERTALTTPA